MRGVAMVGDDADELRRLRQAFRGEGLDVDDDSDDTVATPDTRPLRERRPSQPLLVACRALRELDQVLALDMGADDVLDADWSALGFAARLRAHWRRAGRDANARNPRIRRVRNLGYLFSPNTR